LSRVFYPFLFNSFSIDSYSTRPTRLPLLADTNHSGSYVISRGASINQTCGIFWSKNWSSCTYFNIKFVLFEQESICTIVSCTTNFGSILFLHILFQPRVWILFHHLPFPFDTYYIFVFVKDIWFPLKTKFHLFELYICQETWDCEIAIRNYCRWVFRQFLLKFYSKISESWTHQIYVVSHCNPHWVLDLAL